MAISAAALTHVPAAVPLLKPPQNGNHQNRKNQTKNAEKPPKQAVFLQNLVGVRGLEPRASCSQSRRATNCATPRYEVVGLPGRILPKQARYQLRYTRLWNFLVVVKVVFRLSPLLEQFLLLVVPQRVAGLQFFLIDGTHVAPKASVLPLTQYPVSVNTLNHIA